jgi:hypothetical protein
VGRPAHSLKIRGRLIRCPAGLLPLALQPPAAESQPLGHLSPRRRLGPLVYLNIALRPIFYSAIY